jgi:hypothetical protein
MFASDSLLADTSSSGSRSLNGHFLKPGVENVAAWSEPEFVEGCALAGVETPESVG